MTSYYKKVVRRKLDDMNERWAKVYATVRTCPRCEIRLSFEELFLEAGTKRSEWKASCSKCGERLSPVHIQPV